MMTICSGGNFSNYEKMSVKKVIFIEKLATDCRPGPET